MVEDKERVKVEKLVNDNPRFRKLFEEHEIFEKQLRMLEDRPFLTPEEEIERKKIQKLKLIGKDEMEQILSDCR